jgi:hypothetical protein
VTVPEQVAVPLVQVAVVGAAEQLCPREVIVMAPAAPPDTAIVAVAVHALLNEARLTDPVPLRVPPLTYVADATPVERNVILGWRALVVVEATVMGELTFSAEVNDALVKFPARVAVVLSTDGDKPTT